MLEEFERGFGVGAGTRVGGEVVVGDACIGHEGERADLDRLLLDAGVIVRVIVGGIIVLELKPVKALDGAIGAGFDEEMLLGGRNVKDVEGLSADVVEGGGDLEGDGGIGGGVEGVSGDGALTLRVSWAIAMVESKRRVRRRVSMEERRNRRGLVIENS